MGSTLALAEQEISTADHGLADGSDPAQFALSDHAGMGFANAPSRHLLVIDNRVVGWQQLAAGASPNTDILIIDGTSDGVVKIAERMLDGPQYGSLQIVSHGNAGTMTLGNRTIDASAIAQFQTQWDLIGQGLAVDADILLYGCDIAVGGYGADFLSALARATKADVAASSDATGAARLGGDWDLEVRTGVIEAESAINLQTQDSYDSLMFAAAITVVQTSEPGTTPNVLSTTTPDNFETITATVGEVIRYRAAVMITESPAGGAAEMRVTLPNGLTFLNDGSATVGLVSDFGQMSSDTLPAASLMSDSALDSTFSAFTDIRSLRPDYTLSNSGAGNAVVNGTTNPSGLAGATIDTFGSGDDIRFVLGNIGNFSADNDTEFVVLEFNVVVDNQLSNQAAVNGVVSATSLPVSFTLDQGGSTVSVSDIDTVVLVEPTVASVDKRMVSLNGNLLTFEARFTNTGDSALHDVHVVDDFTGQTNASFGSVTGLPAGALNNSTAAGLDLVLASVAPGATVVTTYTVNVADITAPIPSTDVIVSGTSLSAQGTSLQVRDGEDGSGSVITGIPISNTSGERTGADGVGTDTTILNNYVGAAGSALSTLRGQLWDDTLLRNDLLDTGAQESGLAGVPITLTWAGVDGVFGNADDVVSNTTTSTAPGSLGAYAFGALQPGQYRVSVPTLINDSASGELQIVYDAGGAPLGDGQLTLNIPAANDTTGADFGYIRQNLAPTIAAPNSGEISSAGTLNFVGANQIVIADPDLQEQVNPAPLPANFQTVLTVAQGNLSLADLPGVTMTGNGSSTVELVGRLADINLALATLVYTPAANNSGGDTLNITVNDRGNFGDFDQDAVPSEAIDDNRQAVHAITLTAVPAEVIEPPPTPPPLPGPLPAPVPELVPPPPSLRTIDSPPVNPIVVAPPVLLPLFAHYIDPASPNNPFDPYQPWTQNNIFAPISATSSDRAEVNVGKVSPSIVKAANLTQDDCVDVPKPKPKAIKRVAPARSLSDTVKPFSEQINAANKVFRRTVAPLNPASKC